MIFDKKNLKIAILDAIEFEYENDTSHIKNRNFSALSLRIKSKCVIKYNNGSLNLGDGCLTYFPAGVNYTRFSEYDKMIVIHFDVQNYVSYKIQSIIPKDYKKIEQIFCEILRLWTQKRDSYYYEATSLLYKLFAILSNDIYDNDLPETIKAAVDYIHTNYTDCTLKIDSVAKKVGISEVYLRKQFKNFFGISPKKYIIDLRLEHAKTLLNSASVTVSEAAERAGFNDVKYFSTVFKEKLGYPPSKQQYNWIK